MNRIIKYIMLLCLLAIATEADAEEVRVIPISPRIYMSIGEVETSQSLRFSADTKNRYNESGNKNNDVRFRFILLRKAAVIIDNAFSELSETTLRLEDSEEKEIVTSSDYIELMDFKVGFPIPQDYRFRINNDKAAIEENQASIVRILDPGEYYGYCEGSDLGDQPNNGIIQTNFHIIYLGESPDNRLELGPYKQDFVYQQTIDCFNEIMYKYYQNITLESPMSLSISTNSGNDFQFELSKFGSIIANSNDYPSGDKNKASIPKINLKPGSYSILTRFPKLGACLDMEIKGTMMPILVGDMITDPIKIGTISDGTNYQTTFDTSEYFDDKYTKNYCSDVFHTFEIKSTKYVTISTSADIQEGGIVELFTYGSTRKTIVRSDVSQNTVLYAGKLSPGIYHLASEGKKYNGKMTLGIQGYEYSERAYTPSATKNYITTLTPRVPASIEQMLATSKEAIHNINYYDFLGRPEQTVQYAASPTLQDIITHTEYDGFGRETAKWLPALNALSAAYVPLNNVKNSALDIYSDNFAYEKLMYENTPLNRVVENYGPGAAWHTTGHSVKNGYRPNNMNDKCLFFSVNGERSQPVIRLRTEKYAAKELKVVETKDEDGRAGYQFTDKRDNVILERQIADGDTLDTYHVYDDFNNLCFVLPPLAADSLREDNTQRILDCYAYQYRYDNRNRCVGKKLPGCEWAEMIYDRTDHLIFTRDGEQKKRNEWSFSIPDMLGREVLTGICKGTPERATVGSAKVYATFTPEQPSARYGYTIQLPQGISLSDLEMLKVDYFDTYAYQVRGVFGSSLNYVADENYGKRYESEQAPNHCKGLLTGSVTRVLESEQELYATYYYDYNRNLIQSRQTTANSKVIVIKSAYNFSGQPTAVCEEYDNNVRLEKRNMYDHMGRLTEEKHTVNGHSPTRFKHGYDKLGRTQSLTRFSGTDSITTTNKYNIRNWLTEIDNPAFRQTIHYTDGVGTPCYNGNISSTTWKANSPVVRGYKFTYDGLSRLKNANYGEGETLSANQSRFDEQITEYDKMGNILKLKRSGQIAENSYGVIDNLSLSYNGNQLKAVNDGAINPVYGNGFEFKDGIKQTTEYAYDANGNLTQDLNKKITDIQYNCLNLPSRIQFEGGNSISHLYDAGGVKLRTTHIINGVTRTTDYCGNAIYENGVLVKLLTSCGYITLPDANYHYFIQDHLGNNRVVVNSSGTVEEVNHYYPFGGVFASSGNVQPYKYNGKELDTTNGLNWYDYGARQYDAALGRWHVFDPMSEKYFSASPYVYCGNNPVNYIDPNGMSYFGYTIDEWGRLTKVNNEGGVEYDVLYNESKYSSKTVKDYDTTGNKTGIKISKGILGEKGNMSAKQIISPVKSVDDHDIGKTVISHSYVVESDEESLAIMNFLDKNTDVEWGNTLMKNGQGESMNLLITSHEKDKISMSSVHSWKYLGGDYKIFRDDHIHPGKGITDASREDKQSAANIVRDHPKAVFRILNNGKYYKY